MTKWHVSRDRQRLPSKARTDIGTVMLADAVKAPVSARVLPVSVIHGLA